MIMRINSIVKRSYLNRVTKKIYKNALFNLQISLKLH